jgi:hypothetical protein
MILATSCPDGSNAYVAIWLGPKIADQIRRMTGYGIGEAPYGQLLAHP